MTMRVVAGWGGGVQVDRSFPRRSVGRPTIGGQAALCRPDSSGRPSASDKSARRQVTCGILGCDPAPGVPAGQ